MKKLVVKENGIGNILTEGTLKEIKEYLLTELDDLIDWLDEDENNWDDFEGMKKELKENIETSESTEEIEQAFEYINTEMSWWGVFIEE